MKDSKVLEGRKEVNVPTLGFFHFWNGFAASAKKFCCSCFNSLIRPYVTSGLFILYVEMFISFFALFIKDKNSCMMSWILNFYKV